MKIRVAVALVLLSIGTAVSAQTLLRGDVVVGIGYIPIMCPTPPGVLVFSPDLTERSAIYGSGNVAVDAYGHTYLLSDVITPVLWVLDPHFKQIRAIDLLEHSSSFTVDETGRAYVVGESGLVRVYSPEGRLVLTFTLPDVVTPVRNTSIDMGPDRCMLVYVGTDGAAERYDVCSGTALAPVGSNFDAVRALGDGGFAGATAGRVEFFDGSGRMVSSTAAPSKDRVNALAFGADGKTLWVAAATHIFAMHLGNQPVVTAESALDIAVGLSLAVFGEARPAVPPAEPKRRSARH